MPVTNEELLPAQDNRKSGIALIAGSIGGIVTMAVHPTAALPGMTAAGAAHLSMISGIAHSLAMVSVLLMFLGACGLHSAVAARDRLSFIAIVTFAFGCVAIMIAASISGFVIPSVLKHMMRDGAGNARQWQIAIDSIFQINQAMSRLYSIAAGIAVFLWSLSALRNGGFSRAIAIYGCVSGFLVILVVGSGHLQLNVHGMALVMMAEVIWFSLVGATLIRARH